MGFMITATGDRKIKLRGATAVADRYFDTDGDESTTIGTYIPESWTHVAVTFDNSSNQINMYCDGELTNTLDADLLGGLGSNFWSTLIGQSYLEGNTTTRQYLNGGRMWNNKTFGADVYMQDYVMEDRVFSANEIAVMAETEIVQPKSYTVQFVDYNGSVLKEEIVEEGENATAPADPTREGYTFTGWDVGFSIVTGNLTVTAQYQVNESKPTLVGATTSAKDFISIVETAKNSKVWELTFKVTENYSNGEMKVVPYSIKISANNANVDGRYDLGAYTLIYEIKGNGSNIKEFRVVLN